MRIACVLVVAFAIGCGGSKDEATSGDETAEAPAAFDLAAQVPDAPDLYGPFAKLSFASTADEVKAALPAFFEDPSTYDDYITGMASVGDVIVSVDVGKTLRQVGFTLPAAAVAGFEAKWGKGKPVERLGKKGQVWLNAEKGVKVSAIDDFSPGDVKFEIQPYITYAAIIDRNGGKDTFSPGQVLGKAAPALIATYPDYIKPKDPNSPSAKAAEAMMKNAMKDVEKDLAAYGMNIDRDKNKPDVDAKLPGTAYGDGETLVVVHFDDAHKVRSYTVMLKTEGYPAGRDEIVAAVDAAWGESKTLKDVLGDKKFWYDAEKGIRVSAKVEDDGVELEYSRYLPLANLIGAKGPKWGFETTPLVGATADALAKAYPSFEAKPDGSSATVDFLPTDYEGATGTTSILMFLTDGTVREWRLTLEYEDYGPAKEEMQGLLAAKFGEPKKVDDDTVLYGKSPKVEVRDSSITKSLDIKVGK